MKIFYFLILLLLISLTRVYSQDILTLNEIKPGMKGYGLTVFKGIKVEPFDVEIISVLKKDRPQSGLILARLGHQDIIDKAGVIAGMSGSPIYIQNKLIGALAFSYGPFSKEPIVGITPIQDMLKILTFTNINDKSLFKANSGAESKEMQMIKTPLFIQGASALLIQSCQTEFEKLNFLPMNTTSNSTDLEVPEKFTPGAAVGVNLVTGDMNISGIGTVTYTNKDKIIIFGHPMFFSGHTDMPLSFAYIYTILPSLDHSFKMGASTKIIGKIYQDQLTGLAGILNEKSDMIPLKINIKYFNQQNTYNYNIIKSYDFFPEFFNLTIYNSLSMLGGYFENNTMNLTFDMTFDNNKHIYLTNTMVAASTFESLKNNIIYILNPIRQLMLNKFQEVQIKKIDINININNLIKIAEIKEVVIPKRIYSPGQVVKLKIKLVPFQSEPFYKTISIKLPNNINDKKFMLIVSSDRERQYIDFLLSPQKYDPQNFEQLVFLFNSLAKITDLAVWSITKDKSLVYNGETLEGIPNSYFSIFNNSTELNTGSNLVQIKYKIPVDYVISGAASLIIDIKKDLIK